MPARCGTTAFQADVGFERLGYDCNGTAAAPAPVSATRKFPPRELFGTAHIHQPFEGRQSISESADLIALQ
jgi:hypothetical protein